MVLMILGWVRCLCVMELLAVKEKEVEFRVRGPEGLNSKGVWPARELMSLFACLLFGSSSPS